MDNKILIIAEISANHNNDLNLTKKTIEAIKKSGADAVKIQTYKPESLTLKLNDGYFLHPSSIHLLYTTFTICIVLWILHYLALSSHLYLALVAVPGSNRM